MLFVDIILPVFLIVLAGFVTERVGRLDFRTLTNCSLYLLSPALVFSALTKQEVNYGLALNLFLFMVIYTASLLCISWACGKALRLQRETRTALSLATAFMNVGNFGLPLAYFAFGEKGLDISILTFVMFNIPLSTLAIVIAQGSGAHFFKALTNTLKIPIFLAVIAAMLLKGANIAVPLFLLRPIDLLGQAAIPLMILLLGMQLARTRVIPSFGFLALTVLLRLCLAPLVALGVTTLLGLEGLTRNVVILQTSTPAAVLTLLYSMRFGSRPDLVAGAIFVTTLLSALTLTVILYLLQ